MSPKRLRRFMALNAYIQGKKSSQINDLLFYLNKLGKSKQKKENNKGNTGKKENR